MKKYKNISYLVVALSLAFPLTIKAQIRVLSLMQDFKMIVDFMPQLLFGLSTIYFLWGVSQFILHSDEDKLRQTGKTKMIWGVVALFVFVSIFGILGLVEDLIGVDTPVTPYIPSTGFNPSPFPGSVNQNNP